MKRREKILALVASCVVVGWLGLPQLHSIFVAPIEDKRIELEAANRQLAETTRTLTEIQQASQALKQWRLRSLPPSPLDAQRHYQDWLTDLAQLVGFEELKVTPGRTTPQGGAYTGVHVVLEGKARMSHVGDFLYHFYRTDLPHRIVSMNVDCPKAEGDPILALSLTAEGLAIRGAPRRDYLFPTAHLSDGFTSSAAAQEIEVEHDGDFPQGATMRIRIGNEYLKVLARDGRRWTVEGSRDATSAGTHVAGDAVELAPVWPGYADLTPDDFRQLVGNSPFVKPSPPVEPLKVVENRIRRDDAVKDTFLAASILTSGQPSAWFYRRSNSDRTVIREQSELNIGDLHAVVLDIQPDHVVIRHDDASWRIGMGDSLSAMQKLPDEEDPDSSQQVVGESIEDTDQADETVTPTQDRAAAPDDDNAVGDSS